MIRREFLPLLRARPGVGILVGISWPVAYFVVFAMSRRQSFVLVMFVLFASFCFARLSFPKCYQVMPGRRHVFK